MDKILVFVLCMFLGILAGCSSSPESKLPNKPKADTVNIPDDFPAPPATTKESVSYPWQRSAIHLETYTTSLLNMYNQRSHNLMLCVYQLSDIGVFNNLLSQASNDSNILNKIIACNNFDGSIVSARRIFVKPKYHRLDSFDREKDVRFVVFVAGYNNNLTTENVIIREIPIKYARSGLVFKDEEYSVAELNVRFFVGMDKIQDLRDGETFELYQRKEDEEVSKPSKDIPLSGGTEQYDH